MISEAKKKANNRYIAKNIYQKGLKLNRNTDLDILEYLETIDNFNGYIKQLIREDMKRK